MAHFSPHLTRVSSAPGLETIGDSPNAWQHLSGAKATKVIVHLRLADAPGSARREEAHGVELQTFLAVVFPKMLVERELLSLNLSAHPLDFFTFDNGFTRMKDLPSITTGKTVKIVGSVIRYQTPPTRNGNRIVYVMMEDGTGVADVTVFSNVQEKCGQVLFREDWLIVKGRIQRRGPKALSIIADNLSSVRWDA